MIFLPDVNVWLALVYAQHTHAADARRFLDSEDQPELAMCRITKMALLRLATNPSVMGPDAMTPARAWQMMDRLLALDGIFFAGEPRGIDEIWREKTSGIPAGTNFWTDAYLAAFGRLSGFTIVTFDRGFSRYKKARVRILAAPK